MDRSSDETLLELLEKIKENNNDIDLIKRAKKKIDTFSKGSTEQILDAMESSGVYLGMTRERIWGYLEEVGAINGMINTYTHERLKKSRKIKYIKILLHNELKDFKKVIEDKKDDVKELMLEKLEYKISRDLLEAEELDRKSRELNKIIMESIGK